MDFTAAVADIAASNNHKSRKGGNFDDIRKIQNLKDNRHSDISTIPQDFNSEAQSWCANIQADTRYTIKEKLSFSIPSGQGGGTIIFSPRFAGAATLTFTTPKKTICQEISIANADGGTNNIRIGQVQFMEHILALLSACNIDVDISISQAHFPLLNNGVLPFLQTLGPKLSDKGRTAYITVSRPVLRHFDHGAYAIFEPDTGEKTLYLDHQVSHPHNAIGTERITAEITPQLFASCAEARTIAYGQRAQILQITSPLQILSRFLGNFFKTIRHISLFSQENTTLVGDDQIKNPRDNFVLGHKNLEVICHEIQDKLAILKLLESQFPGSKFVGKITTFRTSHANDLEMARHLTQNTFLKQVS